MFKLDNDLRRDIEKIHTIRFKQKCISLALKIFVCLAAIGLAAVLFACGSGPTFPDF